MLTVGIFCWAFSKGTFTCYNNKILWYVEYLFRKPLEFQFLVGQILCRSSDLCFVARCLGSSSICHLYLLLSFGTLSNNLSTDRLLSFIAEFPIVKAALVFTVEPVSQVVLAGKPVRMNCTATAPKGRIFYSWTHNGAKVTDSASLQIIMGGNGVSLYISKADVKRDRGKYVCTATKKDGQQIVSSTATLSVHSKFIYL